MNLVNEEAGPAAETPSTWDAEDPDVTVRIRAEVEHPGGGALRIGDVVENCRLVARLGRGSSGQVFLARDLRLGERQTVLKITSDRNDEHMKQARLQHTHIMPLFWARVHHPAGVRVLAMPYLGKTTLAQLLQSLGNPSGQERGGPAIFDALQADHITAQEQTASTLKRTGWVEFVVRTGQTLARTLAYAHQRDLLHLDVKPANILLTPDGQPILLDLDVARPPLAAGDTVVPWLGGTPAYMSPEQRQAIAALTRNLPLPLAVDGRSDLYALGLVLYEALGGTWTQDHPPAPLDLPRMNPRVGRDLAALIARCLAENPADRYADGNALADDLDRYLRDLPLRGVRNTPLERWRKWRRRRPLGLPLAGLIAGFLAASVVAGVNVVGVNEERRTQAEIALAEGQEWQRKGQHEAAVRRFRAGQELAEQSFAAWPLQQQLALRLRSAERLQTADELSRALHLMRFYALQDGTPRRLQHVLEAGGRNAWNKRGLLLDRSAGKLEPALEKNIESQLLESLVLWSDWQMRLAPATHRELVRAEVIKALGEGEALFGPSFGLQLARSEHAGIPLAEGLKPTAAWEYCAWGRRELKAGDMAGALRHFEQALKIEPLGFAPHLHRSVAWMAAQDHAKALADLAFCLGKEPAPECLLLSAQCHAALEQFEPALVDLDLALAADPSLAAVYQERGRVLSRLGRPDEAAKDFALARQLRDGP